MKKPERHKQRFLELRKDFEVRYRFLTKEEGGKRTGPPAQGYRSDWSYEGDDIKETGMFMIYPIFLKDDGEPYEMDTFVPNEEEAQMFILSDELRKSVHAQRIRVGTRGYFMEGPIRVAEATVTKLLALSEVTESAGH